MKITYINGNHFSTELTQATVLAGNKLEELRNLPYDDSKLSNTQLPQQSTESGIVYTVLYNVTDLGNTIKKIEVTVNWTDRVDHKVTLSTLKSNDGMRYGSQR
jgi:hypothetical protein